MSHSTSPAPALPHAARWIAAALGIYALAGGLVSFLGWVLNVQRLADWDGDGITIQPNTTIAIMAAGAGLLFLVAGRRRLAATAGVITGLIGATVVFEYVTGIDLGIDSLLLFDRPWGQSTTTVPGRMGPPASTAFTLLGVALVLTLGRRRPRQVATALALVATGIASLAMVGYIFGAGTLYNVPALTAIALQTCTMILALTIGLVTALPDRQPMRVLISDTAAGALARRALPFIVLMPIAIGWLRLRGQEMGYFDTGMGMSLLVLSLIGLLCAVLWWGVRAVAAREAALAAREAALAAVNESRIRADMVLGAARDQFVVLDREGRATYVNDRVLEVTGTSREQILGRTLWELWPNTLGGPLEAAVRRVMEQRAAESLESYFEPWDRWFDIRVHPTTEGGVALFVLDITRRKRAEAALMASEQALKEADRRKDEFLATMAHELRNPLAPIRNAVAILGAKGPPNLELEWAREVIDRQVAQMARLLDDLLDVARITQNRLELRKQRLTAANIVNRSLEASRPLIEAAGHSLVVSVQANDIWVDADPLRLSQVISNLLNNAAKYTPRGGRITLEAISEGSDLVMSVRDTGMGIAPEHLTRVFDMFSQAAPALERSQGGLGIGLSLVRAIVEAHGGHVEARSEGKDQGCRFIVRLPASPIESRRVVAEPVAEAPTSPPTPLRVVVADDNADSVESMATLLRLQGHDVHVAHDGMEAVEAAARVRPDVVLLDIGMPKLNGYEAALRIRELPWAKEALLIALTGWGQEGDRARATEAGFDHHLVKPVELGTLAGLLNRVDSV